MRDISRELAKLLRKRNMAEKQRDGFSPVNVVMGTPELARLRATLHDSELHANGAGGNWKFRYEFGTMQNNVTRSIRAAQGHSQNTGVGDNVLTAVGDI